MSEGRVLTPHGSHRDEPLVIALVASTGGLAPIQAVIGALDPGIAAAVVVLLHQDPNRPSLLSRILARSCDLPVAEAATGDALTAGTVTVVPAGSHLLIDADERPLLIQSGAPPPHRPSADLLLATMATALADRAVAVVLSGHGHDGATGATAVHERGGTVLATDPETSAAFSMPGATIDRDAIIDAVVPVDELGALLNTLAGTTPDQPDPIAGPEVGDRPSTSPSPVPGAHPPRVGEPVARWSSGLTRGRWDVTSVSRLAAPWTGARRLG